MTKLKLSSKMHIMIIVSAVIVAIGLAVGLICQFCADGYFNYGEDYKSYKAVEVNFSSVEVKDGDVVDICKNQFKDLKINYYACNYSDDTELGATYAFRFSESTSSEKLQTAAGNINAELGKKGALLSNASFRTAETKLGGSKALIFGSIALASAVGFQFIYFIIRYKLSAALAALLADVHNLALFLSLLSLTRVPIGSSVFAFSVLCVLMTVIGCCFFFDRVRKNSKDEEFKNADVFAQIDLCAAESVKSAAVSAVGFAAVSVLIFVLLSISALSVTLVLTPALCGLICAAVCVYGTSFFTPAVYSRFKRIGDNFKAAHAKKPAKK